MTGSYAIHEYGGVKPSDILSCDGSETTLLDCLHVELSNLHCISGMPRASVICTGENEDDLLSYNVIYTLDKRCMVIHDHYIQVQAIIQVNEW